MFLAAAGWLLFGLGWVGVFLPGLPTTIFWILAAFAFLRVNRRMYERIVAHPRFGAAIRLFVEEGCISRGGKMVSICAMLMGAGFGVLTIPPLWLKILVASAAAGGSLWVVLLPNPAPVNRVAAVPGRGRLRGSPRSLLFPSAPGTKADRAIEPGRADSSRIDRPG